MKICIYTHIYVWDQFSHVANPPELKLFQQMVRVIERAHIMWAPLELLLTALVQWSVCYKWPGQKNSCLAFETTCHLS